MNEKNTCWQKIFRYSPEGRLTHSSRFLSMGRLKALVYSVVIENEETLHQRVLRPVRKFATTQGTVNMCKRPRSDVSMCALIGVEDILSIPCEL